MQTTFFRKALCAGLLIAAALTTAIAQKLTASGNANSIPTKIMVRILRAEDERRWDPSLAVQIAAPDPPTRKRVSLALGRIGDERALATLFEALKSDKDDDVRQMYVFAIGEIESPTGADALIEIIDDTREAAAVRARAVEALGKIGAVLLSTTGATGNQTALPKAEDKTLAKIRLAILDALKFEAGRRSVPDRLTILLGLTAALRVRPEGAGPIIVKFLGYSDPRIVADALNTMARLRLKDGSDQVRQLLSHSDAIVRANAARAIGAAEDTGAFDALLARALNDDELRVRVSAIRALGSLKDARAAEPLLNRGILLSRAAGLNHSSASTSERIGIPECDEYIARFEACISRVPEAARAQFTAALGQTRSAWKRLAEKPNTKVSLAAACKQAASIQETSLKQYWCTAGLNEILEIVTVTGSLLKNSKSAKALDWLRDVRATLEVKSPEVEIALARIDPQLYLTEEFKFGGSSPATIAQGISELAIIKKSQPEIERDSQFMISWMRGLLNCKSTEASRKCLLQPLGVSPLLQAYAAFQPDDLSVMLRQRLDDGDVIVRSTAAEILGEQTPSDANTHALIDALPRALRDQDLNDAALAILDALAKQKTREANEAIKRALDSSDHLVRRRAVALLKANGAGDFSSRIGTVKTRNTDVDYRRAIARGGHNVTATVVTSRGAFTIEFLTADAPLTVDNFIQLARKGYFNGQTIPRVVPNFVVQAGDPRGDQNGGPGYQIRCEVNEVPYDRAAVGMALSGKDTGGSQWFITHAPQPHLDGGYTVFGRVIRGMEVVDNIARGDTIRRVIVNER